MAANLSQLFVGLFNSATGGYANQFTTSQANALASVVSIVAGQDLSSDTAFVNYTLGNLGVPASGAVHDAAFAAVSGLIATQGRGGAVLAAADYLANVAAKDATNQYYSVGSAFVAKVAVADAYTATHPSTVSVAQLQAGAAGNGGLAFTTANDTITLTGTNNVVTGVVDTVSTSKTTLGSSDLLVGGPTDTVNITTNDDIAAANAATIKGVGTVNFKLNALTAPAANPTAFDVAVTNIDKGVALTFDNSAAVTAIDTLTITGDKGGALRTASAAFPTVSDDTTADASFAINAVGTVASPASLTLGAAAGNVTVNAAGNLSYTASLATGLAQVTTQGTATISADKAVAAIVSSVGDLTVTDLSSAKTVTLTSSTGKVKADTTNMLSSATKVNVTAAKTAAVVAKAATDVVISSTGTSSSSSSLTNDGANTIKSVTVSGNGGAQYLDLTAVGTSLASVTFAGSQNTVVKLDPSKVANLASLAKTGTGTVGLVLDTGTGHTSGNVDLSSQVLDSLSLATDLGDATIATVTVANGQTVNFASTEGTSHTVTLAGKSSTNTATIVLNDGKSDGSHADIAALTLTKLGSVTIDASQDHTAAGTASTSVITSLTLGTTDSTNVNIIGGANGISLGATGVVLTGGNTLSVTGSGAVTANDASTLAAGTFDASAVTGVVTLGTAGSQGVDLTKTANVKTGTAADIVYLKGDAPSTGTSSVSTGAGNDKIYVTAALTNSIAIDGGDGTSDQLIFASGAGLTAATGKTITISNIEKISYTNAVSFDAAQLNGQAYSLTDVSGSTAVTVKVPTTMTSLDMSALTSSLTDATNVATSVFTTDASAATAVTSITGVAIAKNTIGGSTSVAATYTGGAKDDSFIVRAGLGTFTGGAGKDSYDLTAATGGSATKFVTITDFVVASASGTAVDTLKFDTSGTVGTNVGEAGVGTSALTGWTDTSGVLTKAGATLADFITAAQANEVGTTAAAYGFYAAAIGQDLYILDVGATGTSTTDDVVVKLTGVAQLGISVAGHGTTVAAGGVKVVG